MALVRIWSATIRLFETQARSLDEGQGRIFVVKIHERGAADTIGETTGRGFLAMLASASRRPCALHRDTALSNMVNEAPP